MIRLPIPSPIPRPRAGVLVLGPIRQDASGVSYRAWSPGEEDDVALWVDAARVDDDPVRAERLARQAVALARVRHPNLAEVVRLADHSGRLAVIERISGGPPVVGDEEGGRPGPSGVRRALAIGLQAARGLEALHGLGLIHGDLRPDLLSVRGDGRVTLTGLGRVAPPAEDDPDAAGPVRLPDPSAAREDRIALGRVLFELASGSPPGPSGDPGASPPAESINPRVPSAFSALIRRLMTPEGSGGYATIVEAVGELERLAGAPKPGAFLPREELVEAYRECASEFADAPTARVKRTVLRASYGGTAGLAALATLLGLSSLAIGLIGLVAMTAGCSFVVGGLARGGPVFDRARRLVLGGRARDLATVGAAVVLSIAGLEAAGLLGLSVVLGVVAAALAGLQEAFLDRWIDDERRGPLDRAAALLKDLRHHGLAEDRVRAFAVDHGGGRWGPIFLELFGVDAYREALNRRGVSATGRLARVGLSGRAIDAIDARLRARRDERDRALLTRLEERRLIALGVFELTARRRSWRIAPALLSRLRDFEAGAPMPGGTLAAGLLDAVRDPEHVLVDAEAESAADRLKRRALRLVDAITGPRARLLAGLALLVGFLAWAHQNRLIRGEDVSQLYEIARSSDELGDLEALGSALDSRRERIQAQAEGARPLRVRGAPEPVSRLFRGPGAGLAALILLASSAFPGRWAALCSIAAAVIVLLAIDLGVGIFS
ncbi:serine/threonine protein kinase [Tautonia plasticadhaerens]|uniref:Serine/threonine-protein kinase PknH n=1 Tax=Tautonia plasticadhaerens TaxID=2527974 RepID=A0A518H089_9BACT|nr:hypothetical protein [Tautonia plasticadhaerens]QDV34255.1 Serine/threonine-protein kinase PknH [Tautonia plasticadhaerens]